MFFIRIGLSFKDSGEAPAMPASKKHRRQFNGFYLYTTRAGDFFDIFALQRQKCLPGQQYQQNIRWNKSIKPKNSIFHAKPQKIGSKSFLPNTIGRYCNPN